VDRSVINLRRCHSSIGDSIPIAHEESFYAERAPFLVGEVVGVNGPGEAPLS